MVSTAACLISASTAAAVCTLRCNQPVEADHVRRRRNTRRTTTSNKSSNRDTTTQLTPQQRSSSNEYCPRCCFHHIRSTVPVAPCLQHCAGPNTAGAVELAATHAASSQLVHGQKQQRNNRAGAAPNPGTHSRMAAIVEFHHLCKRVRRYGPVHLRVWVRRWCHYLHHVVCHHHMWHRSHHDRWREGRGEERQNRHSSTDTVDTHGHGPTHG